MKKQTVFFTHTIALYALFILGNAVITLPQSDADVFTFTGFLAATLSAFILLALFLPLTNKLLTFKESAKGGFKKCITSLFLFSTALFSLWCAADTFKHFVRFASDIMLSKLPVFFSVLLFIFAVVYFSLRRQEDILKFSLLAFWVVIIIIAFFFIMCIGRYNLRNIFIFKLPSFKIMLSQTKPYFINPVITVIILPVYNVFVFKNKNSKAAFTGLAAGFSLLALCILSSVLLFGASLAGELDYPFVLAVSTVTIGRLFTRLDEFSYFLYFISSLTKINVCTFVTINCLKKINTTFKEKKNEKTQ